MRLFLQDAGDVAVEHADGEAFDDGGFTDAGLADEDGIVFRPAGEYLHGSADFLVAADDRVDFSLTGHFDKIAAIALKGLVFFFGVLVGDALPAADFFQGREDSVVIDGVDAEDLLRLALYLCEGEQKVLGGNKFVLEPVGFLLGLVEDVVERPARAGLGAGGFGEALQLAGDDPANALGVGAELLEKGIEYAIRFGQQGGEQMKGGNLRVIHLLRRLLAREMASWALMVSFSNRIVPPDGVGG